MKTDTKTTITLEAIRALSWRDNPSVCEGDEDRYRITVEAHPNREPWGHHYLIRRGYGKWSLAKSPERAMYYVRQRRALGKR